VALPSLARGVAVAGLATTLGCGGFDELEFTYNSVPPDNATVSFDGIFIHEAVAVGVTARPLDGGEVMADDTRVELVSQNPGVLGVAFVARPRDPADTDGTEGSWDFVIWGVQPGQTVVTVRIDGENEAEIPATVERQ
jgi:hypothetical protein